MADGEVLRGGLNDGAMRVASSVLRSTGEWSPAVHALLNHLEKVGFAGAPRVLEVNVDGNEVLTFIDGEAGRSRIRWRSSRRRASSNGGVLSVATTRRSHRLSHRRMLSGASEESRYVLGRSFVTVISDIGTLSGVTVASSARSIGTSRSLTPRCGILLPRRWVSSHSSMMSAQVATFRGRLTGGGDWPSCAMRTEQPHRMTCSTLRLPT